MTDSPEAIRQQLTLEAADFNADIESNIARANENWPALVAEN